MSTVKMPEPMYAQGDYPSRGEIAFDCYSSDQMEDYAEAYAAEKVREALKAQAPYGYHIVSEANGNGVAFCLADHADAITEFLQAYPGTTIRALALIPQQ